MIHVPVACDSCAEAVLLPADQCLEGQGICPTCGGPALVVPGCAYCERDITLFNALAASFRDADISVSEVARVGVELDEQRTSGAVGAAAALLLARLPFLEEPLTPFLANTERLRLGLSMVSLLLNHRFLLRQSGVIATVVPMRAVAGSP